MSSFATMVETVSRCSDHVDYFQEDVNKPKLFEPACNSSRIGLCDMLSSFSQYTDFLRTQAVFDIKYDGKTSMSHIKYILNMIINQFESTEAKEIARDLIYNLGAIVKSHILIHILEGHTEEKYGNNHYVQFIINLNQKDQLNWKYKKYSNGFNGNLWYNPCDQIKIALVKNPELYATKKKSDYDILDIWVSKYKISVLNPQNLIARVSDLENSVIISDLKNNIMRIPVDTEIVKRDILCFKENMKYYSELGYTFKHSNIESLLELAKLADSICNK